MSDNKPVPAPKPTGNTPDFKSPDFDLEAYASNGSNFTEIIGDDLHIRDIMTGETRMIVDRLALFSRKRPPMEIVYLEDGTPYLTEVGREIVVQPESGPVFSDFIVHMICQKIVEGKNLSKICKTPGMPSYHAFCTWRRAYPWINEALEKSRQDRAELLRDEALDEAMSAQNKNDAPAASLRYEAKKWAAGVDNVKYSPKAKMEVGVTMPTQINIITGIDRGEKDSGK